MNLVINDTGAHMSTNDVPGAVAANNDELRMGCWAEHNDGSLLFVESTENNRVIFSMFDISEDPVTEFREMMVLDEFEEFFSYDPSSADTDTKWTWHDKTPFPWDRVIKQGAKSGVKYASAADQMSAAVRVAKSLELKGQEFDKEKWEHLLDKKVPKSMVKNIQSAIERLPSDKKGKKARKHFEKALKVLGNDG